MHSRDIKKIGRIAFTQSLHPLKRPRLARSVLIVGLDTEYDSETRELLCWTFACQGNRGFYRVEPGEAFNWARLEVVLYEFLTLWGISYNKRHVSGIKLVCYFSIAESQHLADIMFSDVFETSVGVDFLWAGTGGRTLEIVDLLKFFNNPPQPLAKVAESFGLTKLEWDRRQITRADLGRPGFQEYAENDAYLAEQIYNQLRATYAEAYGVDIVLTKTPAQTSSSIYRLRFLGQVCEQPDIYLRRMALAACWGGRNEAFRRGVFTGRHFEYDAFSEYPNSVLQLAILPTAQDWRVSCNMGDLYRFPGLARIRFRFPRSVEFPCLPVFGEQTPNSTKKNGGKLFYPLSGESVCTNAECRLALDLGADLDLVEGYCYETGTDSLARYMAHFLAERAEAKRTGDKIKAHVIKLAINSLIGKFVQRVVKSDLNAIVELATLLEIPTHEIRRFDPESLREMCKDLEFDFDSLNRVSVGNSFYPEWNALILGYARASTSRFLVELSRLGYRPGIVSTDSVIFEQPRGAPEPAPIYEAAGIGFERRETGSHMSIIRTRLYRLGEGAPALVIDPDTGDVTDPAERKLAHHAVPRRKTARLLFEEWIGNPRLASYHYEVKRIHTYRESIVYGRTYGANVVYPDRQTRLGFDYKRNLAGTETKPWATLDRTP